MKVRMGKRALTLVAGLLIGTAAVLGASGTAQASTGGAGHATTTANAATSASGDVEIQSICGYKVTADWLRFRTGPGLRYATKYQKPYGSWVNGYSTGTKYVDGITWRKITDGTWAAAKYLQKGSCQT